MYIIFLTVPETDEFSVIRLPLVLFVITPYIVGELDKDNVIAVVRFVMFIVPILKFWFIVIVPVTEPVSSKTAVSCGKGKFATAGVPPLLVAHPVAPQFCAPAKFQ